MEYLLVMSLSGSTMTSVYLLLRRRQWDKISARTLYLIARIAVLYYLIPLPFLKQWYRQTIWELLQRGKTYATRITLTWTNYAVHTNERLYVNIYAIIQVIVVVAWLAGACSRIGKKFPGYARRMRFIIGYAEKKMTDRHREVIDELKEEYGVRRPVALYHEGEGGHAMTVGVFKPVITCGREPGSREAELLLRHEMIHIRRLDVLWSILLELATLLHWWNPVIKKLYDDFERVCECSCDETVVMGKSREEVREYLRLLIEEAREQKETKDKPPDWENSFSDNVERIKERMDNLMKNKRWNRFAAGALVAALTFANSMTVFAYRDVVHEEVIEDASQEEIEEALNNDTILFVSGGIDEEEVWEFEEFEEFEVLEELNLCYDHQFVDEQGNIYPVAEEDSIEPYCNHDFVSGTEITHGKTSGGGCKLTKYNAQRCTLCGYLIRGEKISTLTYEKCPH